MSGSEPVRLSFAYRVGHRLQEIFKRHAWGLLTLVLASVSVYMLHMLSFAHTGPPKALSQLHIAARTSWPAATSTEIFFKPSKNGLDITFNVPVNGHEFIQLSVTNPTDATTPCQQLQGAQVSHGRGKDGVEWARYTLEVNASKSWIPVTCSVQVAPTEKTFDERAVYIQDIDDSSGSNGFFNTDLSIHFEDFRIGNEPTEIHFEGGTPDVEAGHYPIRNLLYGSQIIAEWRDVRRSQNRDARLLLLGGLFGLATACALEWMKPLITRFMRR